MTDDVKAVEEQGNAVRGSINGRLFVIGALSLLLLIPSTFVGALIQERHGRQQEAIQEVGGKWGAPQTVGGPILQVPYRRYVKDEKGETRTTIEMATFLPATLEVDGALVTEVRKRGIYEVVLYRAALKFSGRFDPVRIDEQAVAKGDVLWDHAFVAVGVTDTRGIEEPVALEWNGARIGLQAGVAGSSVVASGVHGRVPVGEGGSATFSFAIPLRGYESLNFVPVAARTTVNLRSRWLHPSFVGSFLPQRHSGASEGFTATWSVLDLNRSFPQHWLGAGTAIEGARFGVELLQPVDTYQKSDRAQKYAILFIAMTFVTLFFIEMLKREQVHVLNYILSGLAICLFYVLLISLSEHVGFNAAYGIASLATTALITWHARNVFVQRRLCRAVGGLLLVLYGFMFVLLQLQDFALLAGAAGLFVLLAGTMAAASRITSGAS